MRGRVGILCAIVCAVIFGGWAIFKVAAPRRPVLDAAGEPAEDAPPELQYVGMNVCAQCHAELFRSFQQTAHSMAIAALDSKREPADGEFDHPLSGRCYRVYRDADALRHRQWLADDDHAELIQDFPIKYLIGSGRHTRSYLIEDDGFLVESPITWYESHMAWGMSPGYDLKRHFGFERDVHLDCLACHVGRVKNVGDALTRFAIHEHAIGCESCHGPGSLHAERQRAAAAGATKSLGESPPESIVHPGRLSRELRESICARCHLRGDASIPVRTRNIADFRPGHRLTDYAWTTGLAHPPRR